MKPICRTTGLLGIGVAGALLTSSCATMMRGSLQTMTIRSDPDGANVKIFDPQNICVSQGLTPYTVTLKCGRGYFKPASYWVSISKPGYANHRVPITAKKDTGWYAWGNALNFGVGWLIVDPLTGAMWILTPESVGEKLKPIRAASGETSRSLTIVLKEQVPEAWMAHAWPLHPQ